VRTTRRDTAEVTSEGRVSGPEANTGTMIGRCSDRRQSENRDYRRTLHPINTFKIPNSSECEEKR
jgi:hypothetical protein